MVHLTPARRRHQPGPDFLAVLVPVLIRLAMALARFCLVATVAGSARVMRAQRRTAGRIDTLAGGRYVVVGTAPVPR